MKYISFKSLSIFSSILFVFSLISCEKHDVLPTINAVQSTAPKALNLALKGKDLSGQFQVLISYRSPLEGIVSKGIITVSGTSYFRKYDFSKSNFEMEIMLKERGTYSVSILEISDGGNDYVETGDITIK